AAAEVAAVEADEVGADAGELALALHAGEEFGDGEVRIGCDVALRPLHLLGAGCQGVLRHLMNRWAAPSGLDLASAHTQGVALGSGLVAPLAPMTRACWSVGWRGRST